MATTEPGVVGESSGKTLCIAGGGLAALIVLRELTQAITLHDKKMQAPLAIVIVNDGEPDQFGRGLAYASPWQPQYPQNRGSRAELLNSPAVRMSLETVIGVDGDFVHWLQQHACRWQQLLGLQRDTERNSLELRSAPDWPAWESGALERWLDFNRDKLLAGRYETVYFPRCVYGEFLSDIARKVYTTAATAGLSIRTVRGRAMRFSTRNPDLGPHVITIRSDTGELQSLVCHQFVYTAGDMAPSPLCGDPVIHSGVVENPYSNNPHRHARIDSIRQALSGSPGETFTLAIAGCGASAMDQLWAIRNDPSLMSALQQRRMRIVVVAPGRFPHPGTILEPVTRATEIDPLRWIKESEQALIADVVARHLAPQNLPTAEAYFAATERALEELQLDRSPHLFMTFLRQFGAVEQVIKGGLSDIENFAQRFHAKLEAKLVFTPHEYWQALADMRLLDNALEQLHGRIAQVRVAKGGLTLTTDSAVSLACSMLINCTGANNPFEGKQQPEILGDLIRSKLGVDNFTGGLATSSEGQLHFAGGGYSRSTFLCTQGSVGLSRSSRGGAATFIGSNRLTAVRVAERAQRIAVTIAETVK